MKAKHHFWTSLATGGALYLTTHSSATLWGAMLGGFLIDLDHVIDQAWSVLNGAPPIRKQTTEEGKQVGWRGYFTGLLRSRKLIRLPLIFHSYEMLLAMTFFTLYRPSPFLIGFLTGYMLHIALDLWRHLREFNSAFFYFFLYRLANGFRRDRLIKEKYL